MEFKKYTTEFNGKRFVIDEDLPDVGAYLYIYEGEKCIQDTLQDTVEMCKEVALEDFDVPLNGWKEVKEY